MQSVHDQPVGDDDEEEEDGRRRHQLAVPDEEPGDVERLVGDEEHPELHRHRHGTEADRAGVGAAAQLRERCERERGQ